jgi:hypothetical protein
MIVMMRKQYDFNDWLPHMPDAPFLCFSYTHSHILTLHIGQVHPHTQPRASWRWCLDILHCIW